MTVVTSCPHCGKNLVAHVGDRQSAPWLCAVATGGCGTGWWNAELTAGARKVYRHAYRDFGFDAATVVAARDVEMAAR